MQDPFNEQKTHPAGAWQGANRPRPKSGQEGFDRDDDQARPLKVGFRPVP